MKIPQFTVQYQLQRISTNRSFTQSNNIYLLKKQRFHISKNINHLNIHPIIPMLNEELTCLELSDVWHFDNFNWFEIIRGINVVLPTCISTCGLGTTVSLCHLLKWIPHLLCGLISSGYDQMNFWSGFLRLSVSQCRSFSPYLFVHRPKVRFNYNNINKFSSEINK